MTDLRFDDRVAIVTGAGGGLGQAYALLLASRGASVVVNDIGGSVDGTGNDASRAQAVVDKITAAGGKAVADPHSVDDAESGRQIVDTALSEFGRLDVLINNAGILRDSSFHNMQVEDFEAVLKVHLAGSFYVTHPAYRHMREQGYGRIVLTTSAAGLYGNFGQVNYSAAKMGLVGMAKTLAQEGAKRNIRTNLIAPAAASRMTQDLMPVSMKDLLTPESVAPVTAYLAHESCALNGETLTGFGGHVARAFVGETAGVNRTDLTIESVAAALDEIVDTTRFSIPGSPMDTLVSLPQSSR